MQEYWVSATGSVYDSTANWSLSSGGPGGAPVPGPVDIAIFDESGTGNCVLNKDLDVLGFYVRPGYTGIINQTIYPFSIGTNDASFNGGVFYGGSSNITIYGSLYIGNTDFINTSRVCTVWGNFIYNPSPGVIPEPEPVWTDEIILTNAEATSKSTVLTRFPRDPEMVSISIVEGVAQDYGTDYDVYAMTVRWGGKLLDGQLAAGDLVRITYPPDTIPGKFFHNYGTFQMMATNKIFRPNGAEFYNLTLNNDQTPMAYTLIDTSSFVYNNLTLENGCTIAGVDGTIHARGDLYCNQGFGNWSTNHNALIILDASRAQNLFFSGGILPEVWVDKTTSNWAKAFGSSTIYINKDFHLLDGTFATNGLDLKVGTA